MKRAKTKGTKRVKSQSTRRVKPPSDGFPPERRSKSAEESRRFAEARTAHLSHEEREERHRAFNAGIVDLVRSGRIQK